LKGVGIVAALEAEARILDPARSHAHSPKNLPDGALLCLSGIGGFAAERAALALVDAGALALASWGMAGGLDPALRAGTIFLPEHVISADGEEFSTASQWRERLLLTVAARHPIGSGKLLTTSRAMETVAAKAAAFRATGALAVDMESLAVAAVAARHGLPFLAVRVIVDTANDSLPRAIAAATQCGQLRIARLIGALARAPGELSAIVRLVGRYRAATQSLIAIARAGSLGRFAFPTPPDGTVS
jgi:adenosylhomocysteine nucleosidase